MKLARAALATITLGAALVGRADAAPPAPDLRGSLTFVAAPVFGADAATGTGWNEIVVRVDNAGAATARGVLEMSMSQAWSSGEMELAARAPFAVPGGHSAIVQIPTHGFIYYAPQVQLAAKTEKGEILQSVSVPLNGQVAPLLVEVEEPARLSNAVRGWPVPTTWQAATSSSVSNALTVGSPGFDRATGDAILPEHPSGYSGATAVVLRSNRLVALDQTRRDALFAWVNAGGTLAVAPSRPEDLRSAALSTLVGGEATVDAAPARLLLLPAYDKPAPETLGTTPAPHPAKPKSPHGGGGSSSNGAGRADEPHVARVGPLPSVAARLTGYSGGDLIASDFGASAPRGLGEVHLLAFDPTLADAADDPWVQSRIVALLARAWDRKAHVAMPLGAGDRTTGRIDDVRRTLDPNENFRLGLGVSAILLVLYAILVGPLVFARASKRGKPLLPLVWVPVWSAVAFASIVVVGLAEKGWRGRSRRMTLLEAGSGAPLAAARSYRGFFASETSSLRVAPLGPASVLETAPTGGMTGHSNYGTLQIDRDGLTLGNVTSLPWETVVVREDGVADLAEGIAVTTAPSGEVFIENHSGHALEDVLVNARGNAAYFASIADGARVAFGAGRRLGSGLGVAAATSGTLPVHAMGARAIASSLGPAGKHVTEPWYALETAAGDSVDWWPDDRPVLIGELALTTHAKTDAGLALESNRTFVRIVGAETTTP